MERVEYETLFRREEDYWYFIGLRDLVAGTLAGLPARRGAAVLDAGCGTGKLLEALAELRPFGVEYSAHAFPWLRQRGLRQVVRGSVCALPFASASFDVVLCMDVLQCIGPPDDAQAVAEMARVLKPRGTLVLHAAAFQCLFSHHDRATHARRRYTLRQLRTLLAAAGLRVTASSYRNTVLFPIAAAVRLAQKLLAPNPKVAHSDLRPLPRLLNRALTLPLLCENHLLRHRVKLPFGLSAFCVAEKLPSP